MIADGLFSVVVVVGALSPKDAWAETVLETKTARRIKRVDGRCTRQSRALAVANNDWTIVCIYTSKKIWWKRTDRCYCY